MKPDASMDPLWSRALYKKAIEGRPDIGEGLWVLVLNVWHLKSLEGELKDREVEYLNLWAVHPLAWLVSTMILYGAVNCLSDILVM